MGVRDLIRKKKEEFMDAKTEKVSQRLVKLKEESSKEQSRARVYREERQELNKISKAKAERRNLLNERRFGGVKKFINNLENTSEPAKKSKNKTKKIKNKTKKSKNKTKKLKKVVGSNENNPWR